MSEYVWHIVRVAASWNSIRREHLCCVSHCLRVTHFGANSVFVACTQPHNASSLLPGTQAHIQFKNKTI